MESKNLIGSTFRQYNLYTKPQLLIEFDGVEEERYGYEYVDVPHNLFKISCPPSGIVVTIQTSMI